LLHKNIIKKNTLNIDNKIFDYSQELVMLNFLFEIELLSKEEMLTIKRDIMNSYNIKSLDIF
jgi:hypothetical protein